MKEISKEKYQSMTAKESKNSPVLKDCFFAFLFGGSICAVGQAFYQYFMSLGLNEKDSGTAVSITLIFISAVLTAFGYYDKIAKLAGAGTLVPITGFANSVVSAAMEFKNEGFITGLGVKIFSIAGPVILYGMFAGWVYGLIYFILKAVLKII